MQTTRIAKTFNWEMGHRIPNHKGNCKHVHGHSYKMTVELEGTLNDDGMVMDYSDMKKAVKQIIDKWDHCFLVDESDKVMVDFLKANDFRHTLFKTVTTAENIAFYLCEVLKNIYGTHKNLTSIRITVKETETSYATAERQF